MLCFQTVIKISLHIITERDDWHASNSHLHLHRNSACSIRLPSNSFQITDVATINSQHSSVGLVTCYELGSPRLEGG